MSSASDTVTEYLREAQAREHAQASSFEAQLRAAPPGRYRSFLRRHLDETRRHGEQLGERLTDVGAGASPIDLGVGLVQELVGRAVELALAPVGLFASRTQPEALLRQARESIGEEAREVAGYEALERLSAAAGDDITASLARRIRGDEERALQALRDLLGDLVDRVARARFDAAPRGSEQEPAEEPEPEEEREEAPASQTPRAEAEPEPEPEPVPAAGNGGPVVRREEQADSESGSADEVEPPDPRDRDGVPGPEVRIDAPWEGYDDMTATQVIARLRGAEPALVGVVLLYEQANKRRKTILQAASPS